MPLKLYNTLTRKKEIFKPIKGKNVKLYSCGPTTHDYAHMGNFRAFICVDILKRYLKYSGFKVKHIMNITDVDDKTIKGANKEGISLNEYTIKYEKAFFEDIKSLNIDKA
ncbi:class I tRNA ligase family protein, partial [Candidatus Woesearchaeota archaeon]|nr:class I tRNA ligase family protein [Candidatus Woesearchaeota archaeon]